MSACCVAGARQNEKAQLQELNDRLLHYVQNVRNMRDQLSQVDNCADLNRIWDLEEEMLSIRNMYNSEIQSLRDQLEQNCKERMQIEICNHKNSQLIAEFRKSVMALNACIIQKEEERKKLELLLIQKEAELKELQNNTTSCLPQLQAASRELDILHRSIAEIQAKYEKEHRDVMDLQCQIQHLKHNLEVQQEFHCKEIQKMKDKVDESEMLIQQLEEKLRRDTRCDSDAMELVKRIRDCNEAELRQFQEQAEKAYNQNIIDLTLRLDKDHLELQQFQDENRCLRRHINDLTAEIKSLQNKLLYEEETKIAFIEKMTCEHQRNQQHIQMLKTRLEEMQDLVLAKMKELTSQDNKTPCLQGDINSITAVLDDEEKIIRESQVQCCLRKSSANTRNRFSASCIPVNLPHCPLSNCPIPCSSSANQPLCPPVAGLNSCTTPSHPVCPPVSGLSSCNPPSQPPPCLISCTPPRPPVCPPVPCLPPCPPTSQQRCPSVSCMTSCATASQPFCPTAANQISCGSANHSHSLCTGLTSYGVVNSLSCPHSSSLASCMSMSDPHYTMAPTIYKASASSAQTCLCSVPPMGYPKLCQTTGLQKIGHENCGAHCSADETKGHCSRPPSYTVDNKIGQGRDYFNTMFKELKKDSLYSKCPSYKFPTCEQNRPSTSTIGNVKIIEVSPNGQFVRTINISGDKEEDIGNYILQQNVGGHPVMVYRFPPRTRLKPGCSATVWAAMAKVPHNPPVDFLWKEQHKFGTGPECTTILCSPNGQAISWYTPSNVKARCENPIIHYDPLLSPENNRNMAETCDYPKVETDFPIVEPAIFKRVKTSTLLAPIRCPWGQSPANITHPDYCLPRTLSLGNNGSSHCRDSRSQSSRPDPDSRTLYADFPTPVAQRKGSVNRSNTKSMTCSAMPNHRGTLHVGIPSPFASPFQRYYANAAFNIKYPNDSNDYEGC